MPGRLGPVELVIILLIVVLLFGPGRIGNIAGEVGKGIRAFREGLNEPAEKPGRSPEPPAKPADAEPPEARRE